MSSASESLIYFFKDLFKPESARELTKLAMAFAGLVLTAAVIYTASIDPTSKTDNFYLYTMFGVLPVIIGVILVSPLFSGPVDASKMYLFAGILFTFMGAMYLFYRIMNPQSVNFITNILMFLCAFGVIIGLAIIYRVFVRYILNAKGWIGFLLKVVFLIPCLLMDLMESLVVELKSTPRMIVALFVLEILVILGYIYARRAFTVNSSNAIVLLNKPIFLSTRNTIGTSEQFTIDVNDVNNPGKEQDAIRMHYSMSMWVYVNQHPTTVAAYSKETDIFRYGSVNSKNGNPRLTYHNDLSSKKPTSDKYVLYPTSETGSNGITFSMPAQSWNNVVISYNGSSVDVFVNGDLVKSRLFSTPEESPKYNKTDVVDVGYGDNTVTNGGLHGAICNVVYYKQPLTTFEVAANYNLRRYSNPPTIE